MTTVLRGTNDPGIGERLAALLGGRASAIYTKRFPDGELYVRVDEETLRDTHIVVVDTMYPGQNDAWIRLLLTIDAVRRNNPGARIIAVVPYLAYSRQDKVFLPGEPASIRLLLRLLRETGLDELYVIDIHSPGSLAEFNGRHVNIIVSDLLAEAVVKEKNLEKPVILAPDKGAVHRARTAAEAIGAEYDYFVKHRDRYTGEIRMEAKETSLDGRDVVIIDDIISTGGTIALAAANAKRLGARRVIAACSHALLVGGARKKMVEAGVEALYAANTIPLRGDEWLRIVDVSERVAEEISGGMR